MTGSVFLAIVVFMVMLVMSIFMTPLALIPAAVMVVFFLLAGPLLGVIRGTGGERQGSGTPSTGEAAYDPVSSPGQRTV